MTSRNRARSWPERRDEERVQEAARPGWLNVENHVTVGATWSNEEVATERQLQLRSSSPRASLSQL